MLIEARDVAEGVRILTLNRPPANAISRDLSDELCAQCHAARDDAAVRAVIVTGVGRFFSTGVDLKQAAEGKSNLGNLGGAEDDGVFALWTLPKPTVAMVNGHAIAGGTIIALACDFRITASGTHKFGLNEVAIGLAFPYGAYEIARLALTNRSLRYVALEASFLDPARARELGIVDEVVEPTELEARCLDQARRLGRNGQLAYAHTKRTIQQEAIARIMARTPEQKREVNAIMKSDEARALIAGQMRSMGSR
ncbi:MAG: enoyl-CoA hydratase/isomerase family protein [Candidatus Binataceae bacterium]|nr:enoyl-CoA hydratase/isomerase family protein [Candidatus Binataceae bacterium]